MPMKIAWASDIHLDHASEDAELGFLNSVRDSGAEVLLLGGDISTAPRLSKDLYGILEYIEMPIFFVLGNHDYYRGSIKAVRKKEKGLCNPIYHWLPETGHQEICDGVALVGHGGWGDTRLGDFAGSPVVLNDYLMIKELREVFDPREFNGTFGPNTKLQRKLKRLGQESANILAPQLELAAIENRQIIILTHVPPFTEACWHEGQLSDPHWLPGFSCGATGEVIKDAAAAYPNCQFTVLCGHTHSGGHAQIADNLMVHTQAAQYGKPDFQMMEVTEKRVDFVTG